jgi:uncharacterized protein
MEILMQKPFTLLIKPTGPDCNIACKYCFYARKSDMFAAGAHRMSKETLECLVKNYLGLRFPMNSFAWQGGEPTLMGLDFYRQAVQLQRQYGAQGQIVSNAFQTNGILLDDTWGKFLAEYKFLCGISLDGPREFHDDYRKDHAGKGTYDRVLAGIESCRRHGVEFNILVLLNNRNVDYPDELFDFFTSKDLLYLQFVPCVEPNPADPRQPAGYSITPEQYGRFLCCFFDRWRDGWTRKLSVRIFDSMLSCLLGGPHTECTFGAQCSDYIVIEHNGDAYCCDFYVTNETRLGNIHDMPIEQLASHPVKQAFSRKKTELADLCTACQHLDVCQGGCPKDRAVLTGTHVAPSYFCEGYKLFFDHALGHLRQLAGEVHKQHSERPGTKSLYVNGEEIESAIIEDEVSRLRPQYQQVFADQPKQEQEKQLSEWARENIIEAALYRQQARKYFPQIESQEIQTILEQLLQREGQDGTLHQRLRAGTQEKQKLQDEIADQIRHERLQSQIAKTIHQPSEKEIRRYYDQHLADRFTISQMVHAAHIVKHPNADNSKEQQYRQMCEIKEKLDQGVPFEQLAKENSDCPDSAGDLGFFARGRMVPVFEEVVFNLKPGTYSDVFETEFGWHIAKVIEKRPPIPCSLEQVREVIIEDLTRQAQEKALEQFLDAQKEKAHIEER